MSEATVNTKRPDGSNRVVITGMGAITPAGVGVEALWKAVMGRECCIRPIERFDTTDYEVHNAGEICGFDATEHGLTKKESRRFERFVQYAIVASDEAIAQAGLSMEDEDPSRVSVVFGSGIGGIDELESGFKTLFEKGPKRVSPLFVPTMIGNIAAGNIAIRYGCKGPSLPVVTACATSNHNIGEAWRIMKFGDADVMVCGGAEATILPTGVAGFSNMKALSSRNDEPQRASRPYDVDRDGFVMGEGAGVVILETLEHAQKRGAKIYGELVGYGISADAYHLTAPDPEGRGAARCMKMALEHAGMKPEEIDYVNTHGTSTPLGDICEIKAIKAVFGDHAKNGLLISSTKSMTGHLLGAAGGVELAACLMAMQDNIIPPTINVDNQDPECDLDCVPNKARETRVDAVLSNSFGFGGHNSSVIVKRFA